MDRAVDRAAVIANAIALLKSMGEKPSIRKVADVIAAGGKRGTKDGHAVRWTEIAAALKVLPGNSPGNTPAHHGNESTRNGQHPGNTPAQLRVAPADLNGVVVSLPIVQDLLPLPVGNGRAAKTATSEQPEPEWATALRQAVKAMRARNLHELTEPERVTLGRYHALVFGYARKNEHTNKRLSRGALTSLASLIEIVERKSIDLTVGGYVQLAHRFHESIGRAQWFTVCDVRALLILEPA